MNRLMGERGHSTMTFKAYRWKESYSIDDGEIIDEEHKKFFELANKIYGISNPTGQVIGTLKESIDELYIFAENHFSDEETFMEQIKYPYVDEHKALHKRIIQEMNYLTNRFSNQHEKLLPLLQCFVDAWIVRHMMEEDTKIRAFIDFKKSKNENALTVATI